MQLIKLLIRTEFSNEEAIKHIKENTKYIEIIEATNFLTDEIIKLK